MSSELRVQEESREIQSSQVESKGWIGSFRIRRTIIKSGGAKVFGDCTEIWRTHDEDVVKGRTLFVGLRIRTRFQLSIGRIRGSQPEGQ